MKFTKLSIKSRVVVDSNVFISGFVFGGNPQKIIKAWLKNKFILLMSPFLLTEIILVLGKFGFDQNDLAKLKSVLETKALRIIPKRKISLCRDPKDNQILDLCVGGKANYLVTGDKDLLTIKNLHLTQILTPKEFLKQL